MSYWAFLCIGPQEAEEGQAMWGAVPQGSRPLGLPLSKQNHTGCHHMPAAIMQSFELRVNSVMLQAMWGVVPQGSKPLDMLQSKQSRTG